MRLSFSLLSPPLLSFAVDGLKSYLYRLRAMYATYAPCARHAFSVSYACFARRHHILPGVDHSTPPQCQMLFLKTSDVKKKNHGKTNISGFTAAETNNKNRQKRKRFIKITDKTKITFKNVTKKDDDEMYIWDYLC
jgi:hypothetical protein